WQTPTLRYGRYDWLRLTGLESHWTTASAKAEWDREKNLVTLELDGITALEIDPGPGHNLATTTVKIGSETLRVPNPRATVAALPLIHRDGCWTWGRPDPRQLSKRPGLQGPIDDAFMSRFVVVPPDKESAHPKQARWTAFELEHFRSRWRTLMRGDLPEKRADQIDADDIASANLVLWGDP
ncbi:MAG TPA: hypothetical protein PLA50_09550, partial [Bacteroidia bacterium]|nr:hypothetical protein [Bacteroidia bacterium]